jgi:VanZ family protein
VKVARVAGERAASARLRLNVMLAWAGVVFAFAVLPTHLLLSATVGERETVVTQIGHFAEFAVLAVLGAWWLAGQNDDRTTHWPNFLGARVWGAATCYGAAIEVIQLPLTYRSAQLSDLVIDAAGALAGVLAFSCARGALERRDRRRFR